MKKLLLLLLACFVYSVSQAQDINVDQTSFTVEQLVTDILIDSPCAQVSNITWSTGEDSAGGNKNGIGFFNAGGSAFPIQRGVIMTTGDASNSPGPNGAGTLSDSDPNWTGDADLEAAINDGQQTFNATIIEFDFIPTADFISFNFLMASEEYDGGNFECTFSDAFAFLLTDQLGVTTNLALVPGTTDLVTVPNVHLDNAFCTGQNQAFFDQYTAVGGSPTSFDGQTITMTAQSAVVPNDSYHIKLVIADQRDTLFDSAVFLEAGSFNIGGNLGVDRLIVDGNPGCDGEAITLDAGVDSSVMITWFRDGVLIPGEILPTLNVTQSGTYRVDIVFSATCQTTDSVEIEFAPNPIPNPAPDLRECDELDNDGFTDFNLTQNDDDILGIQLPADYTVSYYLTQADADSATNPLVSPYINIANPQTVFARIEDNAFGCFDTTAFDLIVNELAFDNPITDLEVCDDAINDGLVPVDLTVKDAEAIGTQTGVSISYHVNQADADARLNPLPNPYTTIGSPQTIFVRIENDVNTNCFATTTFDVIVNPSPIVNPVTDFILCDNALDGNNANGFVEFDLTSKDIEVLGVQNPANFAITYHLNQADADGDVNPLVSPYTNISNPQTIFVRIEDAVSGVCFDTDSFQLIVNPVPTIINPITDFIQCDDYLDGDGANGFVEFDLSSKDVEILNGQAGLIITYHETQVDADTGVNPLVSPYTNTANPQTIFVRLENANTCFNTGTFQLIVNPLPLVVAPTPLVVCDDNVPDGLTQFDLTVKDDEIRGGVATSTVSYYETLADAQAGVNALPNPYTNLANPQIIFVRVEDINTNCFDTTTLELQVEQAPVANVPLPLEYCDPDSDGFGVFTLTDADAQITGGNPNLTVTYHETMADAQNNVNPLASPYNNIVANQQTIYVRVESTTVTTDCATFVELLLIVNPTPQVIDPTPLEVCDDDADGFAQFDLTSKDAEILNGLDPLQYTVTYHELQVDADAGVNAIAAPAAYTNIVINMQTVYVRILDTANGCYSTTELELIVNPLPVLVQPDPLELCDINNPGDEIEEFTLEDANAQILNGQTGITLTYYETQADADAATNPISSPYPNIVNPQTIYVRADNNITGCVSTITLDLRVNPQPSPATPTPLEVCDDDTDGFAAFDLDSKTLEIINGELDIVITYHETMADADTGVNALTSPYNNIMAFTQTIHVRAENTITGCYTLVELELIVLPTPQVPVAIDDYVICDDDNDGFAQFDLTSKDAEILGTQLPADFPLTYHLTQADADTGNNPIVNPATYTNISNPQIIYVRLASVSNICFGTGQFNLIVEFPPVPVQPTPLELCDDDVADELTVFDLTVKDTEITGGNASWSVSYYETNADAQGDTNAIVDPTMYTNTAIAPNPANPQTLYVRVTDTDTGCFAFTTLTIRVLPNPTPEPNPDDIVICDDINTGDEQELVDLTQNEAQILNGEGGVTATYYEDLADAEAGTNAIVDPTMYTNTNNPQTIYVRVTNDITGCYTIVDFDVIINPLPAVTALTNMILCEINTDGFGQFDLDSKTPEVLNGQDPTIFTVTYHENQADADANINALVSPYTNIVNPQTIFVSITNTVTGCAISTPVFDIEVQEGATATATVDDYVICDNLGDNDGFGQFDLTTQDAEILNGQAAADYTVSYYLTQADADANVNVLPTTYENVTNPQTIYARVDNNSTSCFDTVALTLRVDLLPVVDLDDSYIICVDENGNVITNGISPPVLDTGLSDIDYTFEWTEAGAPTTVLGTGSSYTALQAGTYTVVVTDIATTCQNSDTAIVIQSSPPIVVATVLTQAFSGSHTVEAVATGDGIYEFSIDGGPWVSNSPNDNTYIFEDVSPGEHTITARDINGCGEGSDTVLVIDYPLYFTPNGDSYHDTWNIIGLSGQPNAKIYIFDRYGKLLKQLSPTSIGWNGSYNGQPLPSSDYWFTVEYDEPSDGVRKQYRAHFTLKK